MSLILRDLFPCSIRNWDRTKDEAYASRHLKCKSATLENAMSAAFREYWTMRDQIEKLFEYFPEFKFTGWYRTYDFGCELEKFENYLKAEQPALPDKDLVRCVTE